MEIVKTASNTSHPLHFFVDILTQGKGKGLPRTDHKGPEGERMHSSTLP